MGQRSRVNTHGLRLLWLLVGLVVASCSYEDWMDRLVPERESQFAEEYLTKLRQRDFAFVDEYLSEGVESEVTVDKLVEIADYFPDGEPLSTELIGSHVNVRPGHWEGNFTFEYEFADGWAVAHALVYKHGDRLSVAGFSVTRTVASQREIHRFTLAGKSALQYAVLAIAVIIPIFILATAYVCARTPMHKRKALWMLFILFGFGSVLINWTTGHVGIQPLSFRLLGASAFAAGPHAPWIIGAAFPLGAVIFWIRRRKLAAAEQPTDVAVASEMEVE